MAKEIPIPEELKVLLPEDNKGVVVVGDKAYEIYPLVEGQLERVSKDIAMYFETVFSMDAKCSKCNKVVKDAVKKEIDTCPACKESLVEIRKSPIEAILGGGKVPEWIEMICNVQKVEVQANMTLKQMKHFAGIFYSQNFSDEGLPEESKANFKKLLGMIGMGKEAPAENKEETKTKTTPTPV